MFALLRKPVVASAILLVFQTQGTIVSSEDGRRLRGLSAVEPIATCETADKFCNVLFAGSTCVVSENNRGFCSDTKTPCHCVGKKKYNEKLITTTPTPAPSTPDDGSATNPGCGADFPEKSTELTLWAEWPTLDSDEAWKQLFKDILSYMTRNCANIRTTKLIMRVLNPSFVLSGSNTALHPSETSPLYTGLISKLPKNVQLHFYPYMMDARAQTAWETFGGATGQQNLMANVYKFTNEWNNFLSTVGAPLVKGIIIDNEEIRHLPNFGEILDLQSITALKGDLEFGITIGFDELTRLSNWAPNVDRFYLQVYDLYTPVADVAKTANSPFLKMENDAASMAKFIVEEVLTPKIWQVYNKFAKQITLMWSLQSQGKNCFYPLNDNNCGGNNEFGSWSPKAFNEFIHEFKAAANSNNSLEHAIFQFSFVPKDWVAGSDASNAIEK